GNHVQVGHCGDGVVRTGNAAGHRVLDGQYATVGDAGGDRRGDVGEVAIRQALHVTAPELLDGLVGERAQLALEGDAEPRAVCHYLAISDTSITVMGPRLRASMPDRICDRSPTTTIVACSAGIRRRAT